MANKAKTNKKLKNCMAALVALYNEARQELKNDNFKMEQILHPLHKLFQAIHGIEDNEKAKRKISFNQCTLKDKITDCVRITMNNTVFELTKNDLKSMTHAFDELNDYCLDNKITDNKSIMDFVTRKDIDRSTKHFRLISEERTIHTEIKNKLISTLSASSLEDELIRSAKQAISDNQRGGIPFLKTTQHRFFTVEPLSNLGKKILRAKFEQDKEIEMSMLIPDIWHDSYLNFGTIVASICVHYHIVNGNFQKVKQCSTCKKLFIAQRNDKRFCSKKCSKVSWAVDDKSQAYAKIKCRERQKQFFNYKEDVTLEWYHEDCVGCARDPLPPGGDCNRWVDKHGEEEILRRIRKRRK